jgi:hypothetical protein
MNSGTNTIDAAAILACARRARAAANSAETQALVQAVEWARLHEVDDLDEAATWLVERGRDTGIPIAGEGAPLVSEFAVAEFATALGLTAESGRNLVAQALELYFRLPRIWARVTAGQLAPWRARRIAEETLQLSFEAATFVDQQLAPFAHRTGLAQTQRTVEEAIARFMPAFARERRERAAEGRYFSIEHDQVSFAGTSRIHGELDLADALDLQDAVAAGAAQLAALGSEDPLDIRRAAAVGMLARGEQPLDLQAAGPETRTRVAHCREVVLYVHLSHDALRTGDRNNPVRVENAGGQLLTAGQIADWCGRTDTTKVTVKPVIDLHAYLSTDGYEVPARIAEHVELRDKTCVFPYCNRPARRCDKDHIVPWDEGGETATDNLACLCRLHHRLKTHGGWTYTMLEPGLYLWHSPYGYTYLRDHTGTSDLTPPPAEPPER